MKKIAIILSGCGHQDGGEIRESLFSMLAIEQGGAVYQCLAPNVMQYRVTNHLTNADADEQRNVLVEAARIARGKIIDVTKANPNDYDAVIVPGGTGGMAMTVNNFALVGKNCHVIPEVKTFLQAMAKANKPAGFICIAPACIPDIYGPGVELTIGNNKDVAAILESLGAKHVERAVTDIAVDELHQVVTTPAYMYGDAKISEVFEGVKKLVNKIIALI